MLTITLPWPASILNPNRKNGRSYRVAQAAKESAWNACYYLSHQAVNQHKGEWYPLTGEIPLTITFRQPDKRHRDLDNLLASCKPHLDALATALTVNDRRFHPITLRRGEMVKGGAVIVEIGDTGQKSS